MSKDSVDLLTIQEAAIVTGTSCDFISNALDTGMIPHVLFRRQRKINQYDLLEFVRWRYEGENFDDPFKEIHPIVAEYRMDLIMDDHI